MNRNPLKHLLTLVLLATLPIFAADSQPPARVEKTTASPVKEIGGGIMRSGEIILPALRRYVAKHAWTPWGRVKIKRAALGNDAGMFGVASLFSE